MFELNEKLRGLAAYQPVEARGCVRLDANESFLPLPQAVWEAFCQALGGLEYNRYPDPAAKELCGAFAQYYGIDPQTVVAGNGSDELISVIFQGFLMKGQAFATLDPDFSMYAQAGALAEARHVSIGKRDFQISPEEVVEACRREKVKLLIFSNPCNPTSLALDREAVRHILKGVEALVVLDEAYMDFSDQSLLEEASQYSNLIILRTCSKALGMAAARLGFAAANPKLAGALRPCAGETCWTRPGPRCWPPETNCWPVCGHWPKPGPGDFGFCPARPTLRRWLCPRPSGHRSCC